MFVPAIGRCQLRVIYGITHLTYILGPAIVGFLSDHMSITIECGIKEALHDL